MDFNLFCSSLHQNSIIPLQRNLKRSNWLSNWEQGVPEKQSLTEYALTIELLGCDIRLVLSFSLQREEAFIVKYLEVFQKPTTGWGQAC